MYGTIQIGNLLSVSPALVMLKRAWVRSFVYHSIRWTYSHYVSQHGNAKQPCCQRCLQQTPRDYHCAGIPSRKPKVFSYQLIVEELDALELGKRRKK